MTKEKIMIDGVDVSECEYYNAECDLDFSSCGHICKDTECTYKRKTLLKQLKCKEQECDELRQQLKEFNDLRNRIREDNKVLFQGHWIDIGEE